MIYRVMVTATARAGAVEAFRWIADKSPTAAERWYAGLARAIATLEKNPERHPVAEEESELLGLPIRQMLYGRRRGVYRLLFSVEGEIVTLHYIRHSARGQIEP